MSISLHMANSDYTNMTLALAALFQCAVQVDELASTGQTDDAAFKILIQSIFSLTSKDVPSIYQGAENLKIGMDELIKVLDKSSEKKANPFISRYVFTLIMLQKQLLKKPRLMDELRSRIKKTTTQLEYFGEINPTIVASLADTYMNTISTLRSRLQIIGQASYLSNQQITNKIRALLLAGMRAAVLWQQVGGRNWQFIFARKKILNAVKNLHVSKR